MAAVLTAEQWKSPENDPSDGEMDPIVSELTDSVDDLGRLLSSTANIEWEPPQNRFPLIMDTDEEPETMENIPEIKEEEGLVYYSSQASTSSSEECNGESNGLITDEFCWTTTTNSENVGQLNVLRQKKTNLAVNELKRWSTATMNSVQRPPDATNCDCTAIAFASLRGSKSRRKLKALKEMEESYQKAPSKDPPDSPDSGIDTSSSSSEEKLLQKSVDSATKILPKSPSKRSTRTGRRNFALLLDSFMYKMFRVRSRSSGKDKNNVEHDPNFSPRWRSDTVNEAQPMLKAIQQKESAESQITLTPIKKSLESLTNAKFHFELEQPPTKSPYSSSNREIIAKPLHKTHEVKNLQNGLPPMMPNHSKIAGKLANTERFYYPTGKPVSKAENDAVLQRVQQLFNVQPNMPASGFDEIATRIGLPLYSKKAIFEACCQCSHHPVNLTPTVNFQDFVVYWNKMTSQSHDESSRFIFTLSVAKSGLPGKNYLQREDFHSIFFDLIFTYPGLKFLIDASQFHARYVEVVIARIFWNVNRSWTGKITTFELKKSNFLQTMKLLEKTDEINKITDYFSYEHFYVIYCKFWELDTDHDMIISRDDMRRHGDGALTDRIIDRIFSPAVTRVPRKNYPGIGPIKSGPLETIGFEEFVAFLLAEEDKRHPTAIEYWFRCLDLDGDGVISMYEMELFYKDIATKINQKGYETLSFKDVASQLYDLVSPVDKQIRLSDLKRCGLAYRFFNTFVNYIKYLEQESSDGERASVKMNGDKEMSDWEQFCAVEYEILMTEAGDEGNDESYDLVVDDDGELEDGTYQEN